MKTITRVLAEQIQSKTGLSLVTIHLHAHAFIDSGLCKNLLEALNYMNSIA